jgi:hypothetical protein
MDSKPLRGNEFSPSAYSSGIHLPQRGFGYKAQGCRRFGGYPGYQVNFYPTLKGLRPDAR